MASRPCKASLVCCLVLGMLFGLMGCGGAKTPETAAQRYLEKKYGESFTVGTLSRKSGSGPFSDADYTGTAYSESLPQFPFDMWVSKDCKSVQDTYYAAQMTPYIDAWMQERAEQVWETCKVRDQIEILRCQDDAAYQPGDVESFFSQETFSNTIVLLLPEEEKTEQMGDNVWTFLESVRDAGNGWLTVCWLTEEELEEADVYESAVLSDAEQTQSVSMGLSRNEILKIFTMN
ncbi:MAG: hypothetical protein LUG65_07800 [Clostridiales bacterium]|nr:hypothetical protein [Clostridiales bacterium]